MGFVHSLEEKAPKPSPGNRALSFKQIPSGVGLNNPFELLQI